MIARSNWRSLLIVFGAGSVAAFVAYQILNHGGDHPGEDVSRLDPVSAVTWGWGVAILVWLGLHQFMVASRPQLPDAPREEGHVCDRRVQAFESLLSAAVKGSPARRNELAGVLCALARERSAASGVLLSGELEELCRRAEGGQSARPLSRAAVNGYLREIGALGT